MVVSEVNILAQIEISFSDGIDFKSLTNTTDSNTTYCASSTTDSAGNKTDCAYKTVDLERYKYLLSSKHLDLTIKPGFGHDDLSKLQFEWYATNITKTKIVIQLVFEYPTFISPDYRNLDFLVIKLRPALLVLLQSE
jgi:hypothetical protein